MELIRHDCASAQECSPAGGALTASAPADRRMQLRAYNHWASLLDRRRFPNVADLAGGALGDIAPHSVLLDLTAGADSPSIAYLGERLAQECGAQGTPRTLGEAPDGSLIARLTAHYPTVLVNQAPTGFEAEFTGLRSTLLLYRGILLPFSGDGSTIDFVLAVINWKELAEAEDSPSRGAGAESGAYDRGAPSTLPPLTDWADGPGSELDATNASLLVQGDDLALSAPPGDEAALPCSDIPSTGISRALADRLRGLPLRPFADLLPCGPEFGLALFRRSANGGIALVAEVPHEGELIDRAVRRLAC